MNTNEIAPGNPLEALLDDMHAGRIAPEEFARRLLSEQLFMPVKDDKHSIAGFQRSIQAEPLVVEGEEGERILVLFSTPERARDFVAQYSGYSGGLVAEFSWILKRAAAGMWISINPGQDPGFDFDPEMVAMTAGLMVDDA